jgi:hypothetical protein
MEEIFLNICMAININVKTINELKGQSIEREIFLDDKKYEILVPEIQKLKKYLSSSAMTALQDTAKTKQKQPLLNTIRQILKIYYLKMTPKRKADGYEKNGKKKYRRFYFIESINNIGECDESKSTASSNNISTNSAETDVLV